MSDDIEVNDTMVKVQGHYGTDVCFLFDGRIVVRDRERADIAIIRWECGRWVTTPVLPPPVTATA